MEERLKVRPNESSVSWSEVMNQEKTKSLVMFWWYDIEKREREEEGEEKEERIKKEEQEKLTRIYIWA